MKDLHDFTPTGGDDATPRKKTGKAAKYKAMVKGPNPQDLAADANKPLSPSNPLMVEKRDGSIGQWGNDIVAPAAMAAAKKKQIPLSDKAKGLDNSYNPANGQRQGAEVKTIKPSFRY